MWSLCCLEGVPVWRLHANATLEFDKPFGPLADRSFALWVGLEVILEQQSERSWIVFEHFDTR